MGDVGFVSRHERCVVELLFFGLCQGVRLFVWQVGGEKEDATLLDIVGVWEKGIVSCEVSHNIPRV